MKLIAALLLCGAACTVANPTCNEDDVLKCYTYDPRTESHPFLLTEEDLDTYCVSVKCLIDYHERCGNFGPGNDMPEMFRQYKKLFDALCQKDNPMRKKYLDNASCVNTKLIKVIENCRIEGEGIEPGDKDYCKNIKEHLQCSFDLITKECGKDAKDVYAEIYPGLDFHGCVE